MQSHQPWKASTRSCLLSKPSVSGTLGPVSVRDLLGAKGGGAIFSCFAPSISILSCDLKSRGKEFSSTSILPICLPTCGSFLGPNMTRPSNNRNSIPEKLIGPPSHRLYSCPLSRHVPMWHHIVLGLT